VKIPPSISIARISRSIGIIETPLALRRREFELAAEIGEAQLAQMRFQDEPDFFFAGCRHRATRSVEASSPDPSDVPRVARRNQAKPM
jgi:hypothetical protein